MQEAPPTKHRLVASELPLSPVRTITFAKPKNVAHMADLSLWHNMPRNMNYWGWQTLHKQGPLDQQAHQPCTSHVPALYKPVPLKLVHSVPAAPRKNNHDKRRRTPDMAMLIHLPQACLVPLQPHFCPCWAPHWRREATLAESAVRYPCSETSFATWMAYATLAKWLTAQWCAATTWLLTLALLCDGSVMNPPFAPVLKSSTPISCGYVADGHAWSA